MHENGHNQLAFAVAGCSSCCCAAVPPADGTTSIDSTDPLARNSRPTPVATTCRPTSGCRTKSQAPGRPVLDPAAVLGAGCCVRRASS